MGQGRVKGFSAIVAILVATAVLSGCYGQFALVKTLYKVNGTVDNIYARSGVTALLLIVPVYEFAGLGDAIVVNPIEFWSHVNPVTNKPSVSSSRTQGPGVDPAKNPDGWLTRKDRSGTPVLLAWSYDKTSRMVNAIRITRSVAARGGVAVTLYRSHLSLSGRLDSGAHLSTVTFPDGRARPAAPVF